METPKTLIDACRYTPPKWSVLILSLVAFVQCYRWGAACGFEWAGAAYGLLGLHLALCVMVGKAWRVER